MNLNTTEQNKTSLGTDEKGIVVLVELFAIVILFLKIMIRMLSSFKVLQIFLGMSVASGGENDQNYKVNMALRSETSKQCHTLRTLKFTLYF
jgi:hypothetical protein